MSLNFNPRKDKKKRLHSDLEVAKNESDGLVESIEVVMRPKQAKVQFKDYSEDEFSELPPQPAENFPRPATFLLQSMRK